MSPIRNFAAGPGALPRSVLLAAQQAVTELPGTNLSILGLSHRSRLFGEIRDETEQRIRELLNVPPGYQVLFMQGGGALQFSMVPMAMLRPGETADYVIGGYWSQQAVTSARCHGAVRVVWDGTPDGFQRLPTEGEPLGSSTAAYLHYVSNETVEGLQFKWLLKTSAPLVCDASSDLLSKPLDVSPFSLIYAHAQKNLGPAGLTLVLVRDEVVANIPPGLPPVLDYRAHAGARSILHTPPVFAVYVVLLSLRWLADEVGGLEQMGRINAKKAQLVRDALAAAHPFYRKLIEPTFASDMNVAFRCPTSELDALFVTQATQAGFVGTEGHRSRGGLRISLYNGVTLDDAEAIAVFLSEFAHAQRHNIGNWG